MLFYSCRITVMNNSHELQIGAQMATAIGVAGSAASLARQLGVSTQAVCFYRDGKRRFPEALGARIEALTDGKVTRKALFPDTWRVVWPELVDSDEKRPPLLEQQAQPATETTAQEPSHA